MTAGGRSWPSTRPCGHPPASRRARERRGCLPGGDAARLLRTINARPSAVAKYAGLELGTERYEEAVWALLVAGALEVDGCLPPEEAVGLPFGRAPYRLTPEALRLLEMA